MLFKKNTIIQGAVFMIKIRLKALLSERGINQSEFAALTGIRPSTICDICNNSCVFLKLENIDKMCLALECEISDLISLSDGK